MDTTANRPKTSLFLTLSDRFRDLFSGRRGRDLREHLTAYAMLAPALILIFTFGLFPVAFALYVSLHKWLILQSDFRGLGNYVSAIGNLAYIGAFALGLGALYGAYRLVRTVLDQAKGQPRTVWLLALPGALYAASAMAFLRWAYLQLPEFLNIARKMRGLERTRDLFIRLLSEAFFVPEIFSAWKWFMGLFVLALIVSFFLLNRLRLKNNTAFQRNFAFIGLALAIGVGLLIFTSQSVSAAYLTALETGEDPGFWPQFISIGSGAILLLIGLRLWSSAGGQENRNFFLRLIAATTLMVAAVLLIIEIPTIVASGDKDLWSGLRYTVFFSLGTVPFQLTIALFLSVLLFQRLRGSEFFRIMYFIPYVTPAIAAASVFRLMFSDRISGPINSIMSWFGIPPQAWLAEPKGVFTLLAGAIGIQDFPASIIPSWVSPDLAQIFINWFSGPSLALVVIILLSIWTYVGYNTVIYLAGLANIDTEITEAAEIDGASRWQVFRHVTFPLLSPTTYFLSLIAVMGTFKAFNTIWVMRLCQSLGTVDTFSIVIFDEFFTKTRFGYASALAFVLFFIILGLTYINNRIQGSRVFYG